MSVVVEFYPLLPGVKGALHELTLLQIIWPRLQVQNVQTWPFLRCSAWFAGLRQTSCSYGQKPC